MKELTHLSLFSGFGGLDLAAEWAGFKTIGQCEYAEYPTKVLEKRWPNVPRWRDIRTLTGESFYERTDKRTVDIISGGFPCQPFSVAGKRRGKEDDRYLWPEMVRVIKELRPAWVVGENVAGIIRMALPEILSELEGCGYCTRTFLIPACGVGARHRRNRVAIVGWNTNSRHRDQRQEREMESRENTQSTGICTDVPNSNGNRWGSRGSNWEERYLSDYEKRNLSENKPEQNGWEYRAGEAGKDVADTHGTGGEELHFSKEPDKQGFLGGGYNEGNVCNATGEGFPDRTGQPLGGQGTPEQEPERPGSNVPYTHNGFCKCKNKDVQPGRDASISSSAGEWECAAKPGMGMLAYGIPAGMGGCIDLDFIINHYWDIEPDIPRVATGVRNRVDKLKGFGNAVVPQQFYPVLKYIWEIEQQENALWQQA